MKEKNNYIDRNVTSIIKGTALVFMFVHHFFTIPEFYIDKISYPYLGSFARVFSEPFAICISIFAFLTGYTYCYTKKKTFAYSLKKCTDVWVTYVIVFFILFVPAIALGCENPSVKYFVLEALGLYRPTMYFCWYVDFYLVSMLLLPLFFKVSKNNILIAIIVGIVMPLSLYCYFDNIFSIFGSSEITNMILELIKKFLLWFPCIASGLIFARFRLFFLLFDRLFKDNVKNKFIWVIVCLFMTLMSFMCRHYIPTFDAYFVIFNLDFIYAPLFIYGLVNIICLFKSKKLFYPISIIGRYSLPMWFLHCFFFNSCKEYTQWILYWPQNPVLVILWGLLICLVASVLIMIPIRIILDFKNRLLFRSIINSGEKE